MIMRYDVVIGGGREPVVNRALLTLVWVGFSLGAVQWLVEGSLGGGPCDAHGLGPRIGGCLASDSGLS